MEVRFSCEIEYSCHTRTPHGPVAKDAAAFTYRIKLLVPCLEEYVKPACRAGLDVVVALMPTIVSSFRPKLDRYEELNADAFDGKRAARAQHALPARSDRSRLVRY
ncbi:hypothetical protein EVAR_9657_1 [Eumeta japonica]|uniref:Uncharacterized protein n=1 Tax=Eumeta variegata TaxID=151549 RepID=A0A4C1TKN2_EUMVA|nr:hypothetical protein EVAR_9657_1 [Eumeta japonica]